MKILEYELTGNMIRVTTDDDIIPEAAYQVSDHNDLESIKRELVKKREEVQRRSSVRVVRTTTIRNDLAREGATEKINTAGR